MAEQTAKHLGYLVAEFGKRLGARFETQMASLELTGPQAELIVQLEQPLPMKDVASRLRCDASNLTGLVDRLEKRGMVRRRVRADDRRVKELVLTEAGKRLQRRVLTVIRRQSPITISEPEQIQLIELLEKAVSLLPPA